MATKIEITSGNFDLVIEGDVSKEKRAEMVDEGVRSFFYREGLTNVYKTLLGENKGGKRKEIEYSDANAAALREASETALSPIGTFQVTSITEHVPAESVSSRKQATELWAKIQSDPSSYNPAMLGLANFKVSEADGIEAAHKFLSGLRATPKKG
jgi:hypothetical protein